MTSLIEKIKFALSKIVPGSYVMGIGASLLLGSGYYLVFAKGTGQQQMQSTTLVQVERRTLTSAIQAAGKVTFSSEQQLKFNQKGTVKSVLAKVGDKVKQGQILAELDKTSILSDIRQAELAISTSNLQLQQLENDNTKSLLQAQNSLDVSNQKAPTDISSAERTVEQKQNALDQAKLDLEKQKSSEIQSLAATAQSILSDSDKLLDSFYSILTRDKAARPIQGNYSNLVIDNLLYNDPNAAHGVEFAYLTAVNASDQMHQQYRNNLVTERDPSVLLKALSDANDLARAVNDLGEKIYGMMQGAATDTHTFTPSDLTALRSTLSTDRNTAAGLVNEAETAQANLAATNSNGSGIPSVTLQQKEDALTAAKNDFKTAQDNLAVLKTQTSGDLQTAQQTYVNTSTDNTLQIKLKQNDIAQKAAALQKTRQSLLDYQLRAPFDGVVTHMDYKIGDNLLDTGDTEFANLENPGNIVVTIPLDQVDVVHVHAGMPATISFDAIPGQTFQGIINQIDTTPIAQSGVVSYNVSIQLPTPDGLTILSGMTATVEIETSRKENVLAVPNLALRSQNGQITVHLAAGQSVTVQTGMTDGRYTEITSGLKEGDFVLAVNIPRSTTTTTSSSGNSNAAQQLFRLGGGLGGGGQRGSGGRPD